MQRTCDAKQADLLQRIKAAAHAQGVKRAHDEAPVDEELPAKRAALTTASSPKPADDPYQAASSAATFSSAVDQLHAFLFSDVPVDVRAPIAIQLQPTSCQRGEACTSLCSLESRNAS